jgi:hypothetical protein
MNIQEPQKRVSIEVQIDEIILHGFAQRDRHIIGDAIQSELVRLIAEQGVPSSIQPGREAARLDAGTFALQYGMRPDAIGMQVAQAIYKEMSIPRSEVRKQR